MISDIVWNFLNKKLFFKKMEKDNKNILLVLVFGFDEYQKVNYNKTNQQKNLKTKLLVTINFILIPFSLFPIHFCCHCVWQQTRFLFIYFLFFPYCLYFIICNHSIHMNTSKPYLLIIIKHSSLNNLTFLFIHNFAISGPIKVSL